MNLFFQDKDKDFLFLSFWEMFCNYSSETIVPLFSNNEGIFLFL